MEKIPIGNGLQKVASDYQDDDTIIVKQEPEDESGDTRPEIHAGSSEDPFGGFALKMVEERHIGEKKTITEGLLYGMGPAAGDTELVAVRKKTNTRSTTCRARMEAFNLFEKAVAQRRGGSANVKFGWYGGDREEIRRIVARGFSVGVDGRNVVQLAPFLACLGAAFKSSVDEDGVRHLLLCRVVMGDIAPVVSKGSNLVIPNGADSGVDNVVNPRRYFVSTALMNSLIYPLYVVSFKAPNCLTRVPPLVASASNGSVSCGLDTKLGGLKWGVVKTFKPTDAELVGGFLYNKIERGGSEAFPELDIYGESGMEPWVIWKDFGALKFPHQEYIYFFSRVKKLGKAGIRFCRRVGDAGTWSETEPAKSISLEGHNMQGKLRKFRYEHKNKNFNHHAEWLMDEYTLDNSSSDLALCRVKMNDGSRGRKRNKIASADQEDIEEFGSRKTKSLKLQNMESPHSDERIGTSSIPISLKK